MKFTSALTTVLAALVASTCASPLSGRASEIVIDPKVTYPTAGAVWTLGTQQTITWDTSSIPSADKDQAGLLLLGQSANGSENLNITNPLATQFPIGAGQVTIDVPDVAPGDNYIVVLFGDSGNASPEFTIQV